MGKKQDPDGPPGYDESPPPGFEADSKQQSLEPTLSTSSSSATTYSGVIPKPSIVALDTAPPKYASITIHHWNRLRLVNFPQSVLEAIDGVAKLYYLNGVKWEFEHEQWSLKTNARAFQSADGAAGRYLLLAILTRLSQFGYMPQTMLSANSPAYLDKDSYFFKRITPALPPPPDSALRGFDTLTPTEAGSSKAAALGGMLSKLSLAAGVKDPASAARSLPDIGLIQSLDTSRYHAGRRFFSLDIWRSDRMTILGCPDDGVLDGITQALRVWPHGTESVTSTSNPDGWKWKLKGKPWSTRSDDQLTHSKLLLCAILDELDTRGWDCVMTSRFTKDEDWRDLDTWYFAARA